MTRRNFDLPRLLPLSSSTPYQNRGEGIYIRHLMQVENVTTRTESRDICLDISSINPSRDRTNSEP